MAILDRQIVELVITMGVHLRISATVTGDSLNCCNRRTNSGSMGTLSGAVDYGNWLKASALL